MKFEEGQVEFENKVLFEEMIKDTNSILEKYNQILVEEAVEEKEPENADEMKEVVEEIIEEIINEATEEVSEDTPSDVNFNQDLKENLDEIININKEKGEGEGMAIKKELDEKEVAVEEVVETPENFEGQEDNKEEKVENEAEVMEEAEEEKPAEEKVEEACEKMEEDNKEEDKEEKEDIKEEAEEMSKADKKTYEARIATLEQNIKTLKSELKAAEPYKALYEESLSKVKELEAYKEDVELDKLRTDKVKYAQTCNFDALEDEDKEVVQAKIDDYKFSLYDFKAFMADVLKKYSRKQVYSNMERIISYFSVEDDKKAEDVDMPSDKNMADRILDKYSDAI